MGHEKPTSLGLYADSRSRLGQIYFKNFFNSQINIMLSKKRGNLCPEKEGIKNWLITY
jgi:hypothetical protein